MNKYLNPKNYVRAATTRALSMISPLMKRFEKKIVEYYGSQSLKHQPVFIVGAPRTGSTILYQTLTNLYDVLYVDNLICKFHENLLLGFWLSNRLFEMRPHNSYMAEYGDTAKYGLHAPSECGQFWYRWVPDDHHFIDNDEITPEMVQEIRKEITAVINYFNRPLLIKNLPAGQRLRLLYRCFPEAFVVHIKRDPFFISQSIIHARKANNVSKNELWSVRPKNYYDLLSLDELSMVAAQVYFLEKQIREDMELFKLNNKMTIQYESMVNRFPDVLCEIQKWLGLLRREGNIPRPIVHCTNTISVDESIAAGINKALERYEW